MSKSPRFLTGRFHIETGPDALFKRVRFKMQGVTKLQFHASHFRLRMAERKVPLALLESFDPTTWELISAEVRLDTGKFVASTWRFHHKGCTWWIVIGFNNTVMTVINADPGKHGRNQSIITGSQLFDFAQTVNQTLMDADVNG